MIEPLQVMSRVLVVLEKQPFKVEVSDVAPVTRKEHEVENAWQHRYRIQIWLESCVM